MRFRMQTKLQSERARHTRLFELIRQKNQADTTVARVNGFDFRRVSTEEMIQLQQAALRSLQAQH